MDIVISFFWDKIDLISHKNDELIMFWLDVFSSRSLRTKYGERWP